MPRRRWGIFCEAKCRSQEFALVEHPGFSVLTLGLGKDHCSLLGAIGLQKTFSSSEKEQLRLRVGSIKASRQKRPGRRLWFSPRKISNHRC